MRKGNVYTFIFISIVTVLAALLLSVTSQVLRERQEQNEIAEKKKNILIAMGLVLAGEKADIQKVREIYNARVSGFIVDAQGKTIDRSKDKTPLDVDPEIEDEKKLAERRYPVFVAKEDGVVKIYCVPVYGKGLWSTIYGYLALKADANTVAGITFYKHGETPGLGGKVETAAFQKKFKGKKIFDAAGQLVSLKLVKGGLSAATPGLENKVDAITAATMTSDGVSRFLFKDMKAYDPFLKTLRGGK